MISYLKEIYTNKKQKYVYYKMMEVHNMSSDLTAKDFILLLLNADNQKPIEGNLFIQKEMFLIVKEVYCDLENELNFIAYNYGPYSKKLSCILEDLEKDSLIEIDNTDGNNKYQITDKGMEYLKNKSFSNDVKQKIHNLKAGSNKLGYKGLLRYVYFIYPEYTVNSKIKNDIFGEE